MQLETGTVVDRYAVEGLLGQGGMAIVYRVRHQQLGTLHALKLLLLPAKSIRERLLQEGRVQARLRHANTVNVTDLVEIDGAPGLVMEYIPGPSLDDLLRQCELSLDQVDLLARGILEGVAAAHEVGLVHRDLKPGNVLIEVRKDRLVPKITDFGLAKLVGDEGGGTKTRSGLAMGTPCYMAPEQIRNAKGVDERADVFSLGAVLYEMITGQRAFDGDDTFEIFSAVTSGGYTPIRELVPDAPDRMVAAVAAALTTDLQARVQTVRELVDLWSDGTVAPEAAVAFAPAILARAEELGSGADDTPMSWSPSSEPAVSSAPAPPVVGRGSETVDWSIADDDEGPSSPSIAPVGPAPQAQTSANRGPVLRRMALGVGVAATFALGALLMVGVVGGGVLITTTRDAEDAGVAQKTERQRDVAVAEPAPAVAPDPGADPVRTDGGEPVPADEAVARPAPAPVADPVDPTGADPTDAVADLGDLPDDPGDAGLGLGGAGAGERSVAGAGSEADAGIDDGATDATAPPPPEPAGDPVGEPAATGRVEVLKALHPMTKGASAIISVWLVGEGSRHELPATVPAGSYRISASFNNKDPVDVGSIAVPAGGTVQLGCYAATKSCRQE